MSTVVKVLIGLGFSILTVAGMNALLVTVKNLIIYELSGMPVIIAQMFGMAHVDIVLNAVFAAYSFVIAITAAKRYLPTS